jgi:hypothetical protein
LIFSTYIFEKMARAYLLLVPYPQKWFRNLPPESRSEQTVAARQQHAITIFRDGQTTAIVSGTWRDIRSWCSALMTGGHRAIWEIPGDPGDGACGTPVGVGHFSAGLQDGAIQKGEMELTELVFKSSFVQQWCPGLSGMLPGARYLRISGLLSQPFSSGSTFLCINPCLVTP